MAFPRFVSSCYIALSALLYSSTLPKHVHTSSPFHLNIWAISVSSLHNIQFHAYMFTSSCGRSYQLCRMQELLSIHTKSVLYFNIQYESQGSGVILVAEAVYASIFTS